MTHPKGGHQPIGPDCACGQGDLEPIFHLTPCPRRGSSRLPTLPEFLADAEHALTVALKALARRGTTPLLQNLRPRQVPPAPAVRGPRPAHPRRTRRCGAQRGRAARAGGLGHQPQRALDVVAGQPSTGWPADRSHHSLTEGKGPMDKTVATPADTGERHRVRADSLEPGEWLAPSETGTDEPGEVLGSFDYGVYGVVYRLRTGSDPRVLTCGPSALVDMATAGEINPPSPYGALADELERIAADLRRVDLPVSPYFQINIQPAPSRRGDDKAVVAAVDAVAMAVYGKTGADARMGDGSYHYNIDGRRGPIAVSIYQGISAPARPEPEPEWVGPREVDNGDHPDPVPDGVFGEHEGGPAGRVRPVSRAPAASDAAAFSQQWSAWAKRHGIYGPDGIGHEDVFVSIEADHDEALLEYAVRLVSGAPAILVDSDAYLDQVRAWGVRPRCSPECQAQWSPDGESIRHLPDCPHGVALRLALTGTVAGDEAVTIEAAGGVVVRDERLSGAVRYRVVDGGRHPIGRWMVAGAEERVALVAKARAEAIDEDTYRQFIPVATDQPQQFRDWCDRSGVTVVDPSAAALRAALLRDHVEALRIENTTVAACGCPIHRAPEVRGDSADTIVRHVDGCDADGSVDPKTSVDAAPCYVPNGFQAPEVIAERRAYCAASHPGRECSVPSAPDGGEW